MSSLSIGVLMDLPPTQRYHVATLAAIDHAAAALGLEPDVRVLSTDAVGESDIASSSAIVIGPGSPYRDPEAVLSSIRWARERGIPLVGT